MRYQNVSERDGERCRGFKGQRVFLGLWRATNPGTPPQPDWEHKHDEAMLTGVPDQILEENNCWEAKECLNCKKKKRKKDKRKMIKMEDTK